VSAYVQVSSPLLLGTEGEILAPGSLHVDQDSSRFGREIDHLSGPTAEANTETRADIREQPPFSWWVLLVLTLGGLASVLWALILAQVAVQSIFAIATWFWG
jgi:hypothetical protein